MGAVGPLTVRGAARRLAKKTMLEYLAQLWMRKTRHRIFAYGSLDAKRIGNLLTMAECELVINRTTRHASIPAEFPERQYSISKPRAAAARSERYITKLVHYAYNPQTECPLFSASSPASWATTPTPRTGTGRAERMVEYLKRSIATPSAAPRRRRPSSCVRHRQQRQDDLLSTSCTCSKSTPCCSRWIR